MLDLNKTFLALVNTIGVCSVLVLASLILDVVGWFRVLVNIFCDFIPSDWNPYQFKPFGLTILKCIFTFSWCNTFRDNAAERLHVQDFCLPLKNIVILWYLVKYLNYRDYMVSIWFFRILALICHATRFCRSNGLDSRGQNVKHLQF